MTGLPREAVETLVRWRCDYCGDVWNVDPGTFIGVHVRPNGVPCEGGPVSRIAAVPDGVYVVKDGQVAYRTEEEAISIIAGPLPFNVSGSMQTGIDILAALSATDTEAP